MKKVFSVKKLEEFMKKRGDSKGLIEHYKNVWGNKCDGLTAREMMIKHGCLTVDEWMIEVED